ncbi:transforming growth factor-beta receptor-associated protein 1-like, partial [Tropilaelaps mercedesae]
MSLNAFHLIPVSDTLRDIDGHSLLISCLDLCGSNLFIGSTDGTIYRYTILFRDVGFDAHLPTVDKQVASYAAAPGKAIVQLKALSAINRLVTLNIEGTLSVHDMWHLE